MILRNFKELLLAASMPVCLRLYLIRDPTVYNRGSVLWESGVLNLLNVKAVVVADLLTYASTWRASHWFDALSPQSWLLLLVFFCNLRGFASYLMNCATLSSARSVVLGRC